MATTYATAWSFVGATKRITGYFGFGKPRDVVWWKELLRWLGVSLALAAAWTFVLSWYLFLGVFFFVVIPWRIIRRNHRRQRHLQEQQLEALKGIQQQGGK